MVGKKWSNGWRSPPRPAGRPPLGKGRYRRFWRRPGQRDGVQRIGRYWERGNVAGYAAVKGNVWKAILQSGSSKSQPEERAVKVAETYLEKLGLTDSDVGNWDPSSKNTARAMDTFSPGSPRRRISGPAMLSMSSSSSAISTRSFSVSGREPGV